jgi:hypothetical protein
MLKPPYILSVESARSLRGDCNGARRNSPLDAEAHCLALCRSSTCATAACGGRIQNVVGAQAFNMWIFTIAPLLA